MVVLPCANLAGDASREGATRQPSHQHGHFGRARLLEVWTAKVHAVQTLLRWTPRVRHHTPREAGDSACRSTTSRWLSSRYSPTIRVLYSHEHRDIASYQGRALMRPMARLIATVSEASGHLGRFHTDAATSARHHPEGGCIHQHRRVAIRLLVQNSGRTEHFELRHGGRRNRSVRRAANWTRALERLVEWLKAHRSR
jgi:hypothetical protein